MATQTTTPTQLHPEGLELVGPRGEQRGYVDPKQVEGRYVLEDLWIMQGSVCDLKCTHCYTASSPTNGRLEQITGAELKPHLDAAARFGVQKIYFTGGEVFVNDAVLRGQARVNEDFVANLTAALEIAPVEILTNGRRYIRNHFEVLRRLRERHGDRLRLRVTLESPRAAEHDAIRGATTFQQTVQTIRDLQAMGFVPVLTGERPFLSEQTDEEIRAHYQALFEKPVEVNLIQNMLEMGHQLVQLAAQGQKPRPETFVTTNCFAILGKPAESLMCHFSRCLQKIEGALRYYPCPVIYDDARFELGRTLEESLRRVYVAHKNCYDYCLKGRGATCRTRPI
ncbi:MAG TPA: radical SAM protein [Candidatus Xenobia bacterium]|nr:radical SAM protein [Candidatus Xenobia bacterium]